LRRAKARQNLRAKSCWHFVRYLIAARPTNAKTVWQCSLHDYANACVFAIFGMTCDGHFLIFGHGPEPAPDVACIAIQCDAQLPAVLRSMLNDVVVGTFVNSYESPEPIDFGWVTTIGAAVNLLAASVTVTVPLNVTVPTWYLKGTHVNSLFNWAAVKTWPVVYVFCAI
jgi:hypothetical protein